LARSPVDKAKTDGEEAIAAQCVAGRGIAGNDARTTDQHISEPAFIFQPEQFFK